MGSLLLGDLSLLTGWSTVKHLSPLLRNKQILCKCVRTTRPEKKDTENTDKFTTP